MHSMQPSPSAPPGAEPEPAPAVAAAGPARTTPAGLRRIASSELFAGAVEVEIEHQEQVYRLRRTSLGKLILTK